MFVWSKRLVAALIGLFILTLGIFFLNTAPGSMSDLTMYMTGWMAINYLGLIVWVFVWMIDQARMRGKNVWIWLVWALRTQLHRETDRDGQARVSSAGL